MIPLERLEVPGGGRGRGSGAWRHGIGLLGLALAALLAGGCSWMSLDDRELAEELAQAQQTIAAGDPQSTLLRLEQLAWRRRNSVEVRRLLVDACREVNSIESRRIMETALRELIVLEPENPQVRFELAEVLMSRGFDLDARRQLERVLLNQPDHAGAHLAMGYYHEALYRRYKEQGALAAMLGHFSRAADLDPDLYEAHKKQVETFMVDGQWESALLQLERLRERWPEEGWLWALTGACLTGPGTYPEAEEAFQHAFERMRQAERAPFLDLKLITDPYAFNRYDLLAPDEREDFRRILWRSKDPLPVTRVNERQVQHWRRVVMADLLYAHRRMGVRGWDTARGEMYIRYGPAIYEEYVSGSGMLFPASGWYHIYQVDGGQLALTFFDTVLNGLFYLPFNSDDAGLAAYTTPEDYAHNFGGRWLSPSMQVAAFSFSAPKDRTRAEVYLAVPADSLAAYSGSSLEVGTVVFDREWNELARREEVLDLDTAPVAGEDGRVLVHEVNLDLKPGDYLVAAQVEGEAGEVVGTLTREVQIEAFGGGRVELSTPELAFAVAQEPGSEPFRKGDLSVVPNATGEVRGSELVVLYFEIYNLTVTEGRSRYDIRYRIAPAAKEGRSVFARMGDAFRTRTFIESYLSEEGLSAQVNRHLTIDVGTLKSGHYAIELEVTDISSGAKATRRIEFDRTRARP